MILTFFSMAFLFFFFFLIFRSSLNGHSTEICVALIQSVKPNPSGTCMYMCTQYCLAKDVLRFFSESLLWVWCESKHTRRRECS